MLLSCSLGTLDRVICSWQRLLLPTQHISSHASLYQHLGAANPTCSHKNKVDFAGRGLTLLLGAGCWP